MQTITSELPDEQRREKIETIGDFPIHITFMACLIMNCPGFPDSIGLIYIDNGKGYLFGTPMTDSQR